MNYTEIMSALPKEVVLSLQANFDAMVLSADPTLDEVRASIFDAVKLTQSQVKIEDEIVGRMVGMMLSFLPDAGAKALLG